MSLNWKGLLGGIAPVLARLVGGPAAGEIAAKLSQTLLGKPEANDDELATALAGATPEQLESLRKLEQEYSLQLIDRAVELEKVEAGDRANARERERDTHDPTTRILAYAIKIGRAHV